MTKAGAGQRGAGCGKRWARALLGALAVIAAASCGKVVPVAAPPTTQCLLGCDGTDLRHESIDKVDILFAIDNSASMGDKQALLAASVPDLIDRLLLPDCLTDPADPSSVVARVNGACPNGSKEEFPAVYDMHVGIVTSSLGGGGAPDVCQDGDLNPIAQLSKFNRHNNDKGHLINRKKPDLANPPASGIEDPVGNAKPVDGTGGDFLAWLPSDNPKNQGKLPPNVTPYTTAADEQTLVTDFQSLVAGTQEYGCGLEAQLESFYHFLVQPDPWEDITLAPNTGNPAKAQLVGVDATILKQRHDFLREDSLVAVILVTDEEDSWSDPLAIGGRGWVARTVTYPGSPTGQQAPLPTHECGTFQNGAFVPSVPVAGQETTTGPNDPNCTSCGFAGNKADGTSIAQDPNCQTACGAGCIGFYTAKQDGLNVRYTDNMKARYGFDPQFHIQRYIDGLQSLKVPDRDHETHLGASAPYDAVRNCTNPLFAKGPLPTDPNDVGALCNMPLGPRTPDLVYFAVIGGVPNQLVDDAQGNVKTLADTDWNKIVGKDPQNFDLTGIDPHMIESVAPRPGLPSPNGAATDPVHGREWNTTKSVVGQDLQYACTFDLPAPRDCTDPVNANACDCEGIASSSVDGPPLCGSPPSTMQVKGKAYPSIRELRVARAMGARGIAASICARNTTDESKPDFGYRPAMKAIVDRLRGAFGGQCLPQPLARGTDGAVACTLLVVFQAGVDQATICNPARGLAQVDKSIKDPFDAKRLADLRKVTPQATAADLGPVCQLTQLVPPADFAAGGSCASSQTPGWCYVTAPAANGCPQGVAFSSGGEPAAGTQVTLQCFGPAGDGGT